MRMLLCWILMAIMLTACGSKESRRDSFFQNGLKLEQEGRTAEARIQAKNVLKLDPNHAGAYLLLARCALKEQNWREAFGGFQRAMELEPQNVEALLGVGRLYLMSGETGKVEEISAQILQIDPTSVDGSLLQTGGLLQSKRFEEAQAKLKDILAIDPTNDDAHIALSVFHDAQGRPDEALAVIDQALIARPESQVLHFRAANLAMGNGKMEIAEKHLLRLKELSPDKRGILMLLAGLYEQMKDLPKAEGILRDLLHMEPTSEETRLRLAEHLARVGKAEDALVLLSEAPQGITPKLRLGEAAVHARAGRIGEAQQVLLALAEDPSAGLSSIDARLKLAEIKLLQGYRKESLAQTDEVLRQDPANARAHALRGRLFMLLGQTGEAISELRIALRDSPENEELTILMARAHFAQNNTLSGVEELRSFLTKKPDSVPVRMELAAHYHGQQPEMALNILRDGLAHGNTLQLLVGMGDIEISRERFGEAEKYFRQAAAEGNDVEVPLLRLGSLQMERGNKSAARMTFMELLKDKPDAHGAVEALVALDLDEGHSGKALERSRVRAESRPGDPLAADLFGRTAFSLKNMDMAEKAFREAQRRAPDWTVPPARLAGLYASIGRRDAAEAECRAALERNPESVAEALLLGQLLQLSGEKSQAEKIYRDLLSRRPELLPVANNLAYLLVSLETPTPEQLSEALALASKASSNGDPVSQDTLAWVHYRLGDRDSALEILEQVHRLLPAEPTVTYHLAQVLADKGHTEDAKALLKQTLDKKKDFPEAEAARKLMEKL